jgi:hypothetical protein
MKRFLSTLVFASAVAFAASPSVFAATGIDVAIEEDVVTIDEMASTPDGASTVVGKIANEFNVDEAVIADLRAQKLGYGEISIALSLAERMPGGITDENIASVLDIRQGPPVTGWGNVAKELNLSLKPAATHLERVSDGTEANGGTKKEVVRHEKTTKLERAGKPERVEKAQRPERVERIEKIERIERPERPERSAKR